MTPVWLKPQMAALQAARAADRLPHALLIHDVAGAGGDWLARWVAQLTLCTNANAAPCGGCVGCKRVEASQHPDFVVVQPTDDSKQIRIEQVRELASELALTSHQGGYKVGILTPADAFNRFAANALLKTLEEPPPRTLLILVASVPSRLPATILSRCQRIAVRTPKRAESVAWLEANVGAGDWNAVLDTLGEAPFRAATADLASIPQLGSETRRTLEEVERGAADPAATAERWSRSEPALRLACFENWLTDRIRRHASAHLPRPASVLNIRALFELVDGVRELKFLLDTPINRSLALEGLLRRLKIGP
jgi:DNA polymerase III subunit delta'